MDEGNPYLWWQRGIIYQVYPRSFMDGDGDGVGDLPGVTGRLDHLTDLGVDAVWLSPIYPSPMADFGYDVADYTGVHPLFGTLADFDALVAAAHGRGLKVILDFVPNHTSDEHPWFLASRASRDNPRRDWYLWRDPAPGGGPPNNWLSHFGGGAWEWDEATGQYYYHAFLKEQPDLNWRNPDVRRAMADALRFWLDRGVDGFRVDVIWELIKDEQFRDNPPNPAFQPGRQRPYDALLPVYSSDRPEVHGVIAGLRRVLDEYDDRMMVGEIYLPLDRLVTYYGAEPPEVHLPYNFQLILQPWDARTIAATIDTYEASLPPGGWPNWVLGNHDRPRIASRVGAAQGRVAAMLLLTLRGTPTLYYGDELGMHDVAIPPDRVQDPEELNIPGLGLGRDPERTPMQWDAGPGAGFTTGDPWLPLADDYTTVNVAAERDDPRSLLALHRRLIALRRQEPALAVGAYRPVPAAGDLLAYIREGGGRRFLVVLNLGHRPRTFAADTLPPHGRIALSTHLDRAGEPVAGELALRPDEGVIVEMGG
ncbi:MAG TPA: alpha-amylase family glycosyl hydrolase [Thermomicrobiales bacterium]|nr:alpha-amylase family glycosyl hydrolase [Thermomicrobiales bacterium]